MRTYFCLKVEIPTNQIKSPYRVVYERILDIDDNLSIPYESLLTSMRMLYGSNCQVTFSLHNYV